MFKSEDYGETWSPQPLHVNIKAWVTVSTVSSSIIYGDNMKSTDGGLTWTPLGNLPLFANPYLYATPSEMSFIKVSPGNPNFMLAYTYSRNRVYLASRDGCFRSYDFGFTWLTFPNPYYTYSTVAAQSRMIFDGVDFIIKISSATWSKSTLTLKVSASTNDTGVMSLMVGTAVYPMTYNAKRATWSATVTAVPANPGTVTISVPKGSLTGAVKTAK